jgi:hypothetical protein
MAPKQGQNDMDQYRMPKALKQDKTYSYRVGYTATTGNQTPGEPDLGKTTEQKN